MEKVSSKICGETFRRVTLAALDNMLHTAFIKHRSTLAQEKRILASITYRSQIRHEAETSFNNSLLLMGLSNLSSLLM